MTRYPTKGVTADETAKCIFQHLNVERANQEVIRHLRALLFDKRVYNKWSFEELPLAQRIMNTVEKIATGVTPAELILNNSLRTIYYGQI